MSRTLQRQRRAEKAKRLLHEKQSAGKKGAKGASSSGMSAEQEALLEKIAQDPTSLLALLSKWDADGDGRVSRAEFHKAFPVLGLKADKATLDLIYDSMDYEGEVRDAAGCEGSDRLRCGGGGWATLGCPLWRQLMTLCRSACARHGARALS